MSSHWATERLAHTLLYLLLVKVGSALRGGALAEIRELCDAPRAGQPRAIVQRQRRRLGESRVVFVAFAGERDSSATMEGQPLAM